MTNIVSSWYLSDDKNINKTLRMTGLSLDELEYLVGYFKPSHYKYSGKMKGEVISYITGKGNADCAAKLLSIAAEFQDVDPHWPGRYHSKTPSRKREYAEKLASYVFEEKRMK